jgi:mannose-6-phosphate isomerase-like protein (cupin superfamily)
MEGSMDVFETKDLQAGLPGAGVAYQEFLRVPAMSAGVYRIPAGHADPQSPHQEDEVYVVVSGRAVLLVEGQRREVGPGSVAFVAANAQHRFEEVTEELVTLVFFAPSESEFGE